MNDKDFPDGKPGTDSEKLRVWWEEEMQKCGLQGTVRVDHAPCRSGQAVEIRLIKVLVIQSTTDAHLYRTEIPGAPWPIEAVVLTTNSGLITQVIYHASLKHHLSTGEVRFKKSEGWVGEKFEVEGPGAQSFMERKDFLKQCKKCLNRRYDPPVRGFLASKQTYELKESSLSVEPGPEGSEAIIRLSVQSESAFVGRKYSLGLAPVMDLLKAIEQIG